jgi:hypothetical protein
MLARRMESLARCFGLASLAAGGSALVLDCGTSANRAIDPPDGAVTQEDSGSSVPDAASLDAMVDAAFAEPDAAAVAPSPVEAGRDAASCVLELLLLDGGPDAEEICEYSSACALPVDNLVPVGCTVLPLGPDGGPYAPSWFPSCHLLEGKGCTDGGYDPPASGIVFDCTGCAGGGGRRPAGFGRRRGAPACTAAGAWLASVAELEGASVHAFVALAEELALHGAPARLKDAAAASAQDEVRHARVMARLARARGGAPRAPRAHRLPRRSLGALARQNAVEGCVRETWGALLAAWQAAHARDSEVRAAMETIARDELRHAALAWEIEAWAAPRLSAGQRAVLARAKRRAAARLVAEVAAEVDGSERLALGLPGAQDAAKLARALASTLWT